MLIIFHNGTTSGGSIIRQFFTFHHNQAPEAAEVYTGEGNQSAT